MKPLILALLLGLALSLHAETPLRLCGSTTVQGALQPKLQELESAVGRKIEFSGIGTNAGLMLLADGGVDVAMLSSPLDEVAQAVNRQKPGLIDPKRFHAAHVGDVRLAFVVNPHNRVRELTSAQLVDVLLGRITNWKQVGGADAPVVVVSLANPGPLLQEQLLQGRPITSAARFVPNATQIPVVVAQEANAIGIISAAHARGPTSLIRTDAKVVAPLFLVTREAPSGAILALENAARRVLGAN